MKTDDSFNQGNKSYEETGSNLKDTKKKGGNVTRVALVICILLLLGISGVFIITQQQNMSKIGELKANKHMMAEVIHMRDSTLNDYVRSFNEIDSNIEFIRRKERIIHNESVNNELQTDRRKQILQDIQFLNYLLDKNKKQIAELTQRLSKSGLKLTQFDAKLISLNKMITERDTNIAQLKHDLAKKDFEIAQLNLKVNNMDDQIKQQTSQISNLGNKLNYLDTEENRAYLISGTFKELKGKGVITKKGGFFGLGGYTQMTSNLAENTFEPIDIRNTKSIKVSANNAEFISNHPKDSYEWVKMDNKIQKIVITDPNKFWKYTKYAVLETQ